MNRFFFAVLLAPVAFSLAGSSQPEPTMPAGTLLPTGFLSVRGSAIVGTAGSQPITGDGWVWWCLTGQIPNGRVGEDGKVRPEQAPFIRQMLFQAAGCLGAASTARADAALKTEEPGTQLDLPLELQ